MSVTSQKSKAIAGHGFGGRFLLPWRSLTWQLIFLTILPLTVLVLGVAFGSLAVHQNAMRTLVGERDERAVRTAAEALEEQASHRAIAIRSLSLLADGASANELSAILDSSDYLLPEFDGGLAFFGLDGVLEAARENQHLWESLAFHILPFIQAQGSNGITSSFIPTSSSSPASSDPITLVAVVSPGGEWVAAGAFSAAGMVRHTLAEAFASGPQASVIIIDSDKRLLYESGSFSYSGEISDHPGVAEALRGESGTVYVMVGSEEHVVAYSPIAPLGWALVLEEPWEMVASPTLRASQLAPLVLVPVLILAVMALWFGARQIVRPLQTLESRAATLAWGDFKTIEIPVGGIEEIRQLQDELIQMARKVQAAQQSLHGYIGAITAAQEDERRRLARELHDDTIQSLIALKQRIQLARIHLTDEQSPQEPGKRENKNLLAPKTGQKFGQELSGLDELTTLTEQTIENLRRLTRALRPIYLEDLGLVPALEMLAQEIGPAARISLEFQRRGTERRMDRVVELALYRMAQEALSNVARHAQASQATLNITFTPQSVTLLVTDNGQGFDVPKSPAEFAPGGHYGLLGLHERAELIGAKLEIRSAPGKGTHLSVSLGFSSTPNT